MKIYEPLPGEEEILELRRFPLFVFFVFLRLFLRLFVPFLLLALVAMIFANFSMQNEIFKDMLGFYSIYAAVVVLIAFVEWWNEELDILILTTQRIIAFVQQTLFKRHSSIAALEHIQDVKGSMNGFIENILRIGSVEIQTAAEKIQFIVEEVRHPEQVASIINTELQKAKNRRSNSIGDSIFDGIQENDYLEACLKDTRRQIKMVL